MAKLRVGVLISGRGSNLQALLDACADASFPAEIALVVSNKPGVQGLRRADKANVENLVIDHRDFAGREEFEDAVHRALLAASVELVCLAGFMRILTARFVALWHDRLINIHPSLLPAFKGLDTHERALETGVKIAGCTVHFVRPDMDVGPIISQAAVPVAPDDTAATLAARVLEAEHRLFPDALRLIAEKRLSIVGEVVRLADAPPVTGSLLNPSPRS